MVERNRSSKRNRTRGYALLSVLLLGMLAFAMLFGADFALQMQAKGHSRALGSKLGQDLNGLTVEVAGELIRRGLITGQFVTDGSAPPDWTSWQLAATGATAPWWNFRPGYAKAARPAQQAALTAFVCNAFEIAPRSFTLGGANVIGFAPFDTASQAPFPCFSAVSATRPRGIVVVRVAFADSDGFSVTFSASSTVPRPLVAGFSSPTGPYELGTEPDSATDTVVLDLPVPVGGHHAAE